MYKGLTSGMDTSEIKEWHIELRDNELSMDEENVKTKKKKLEHDERVLDEQLAAEKQEKEEREEKLAEQEKEVTVNYHTWLPDADYIAYEVAETRDNLRRLELEFREKNAILEILLKVWCLAQDKAFEAPTVSWLANDCLLTDC